MLSDFESQSCSKLMGDCVFLPIDASSDWLHEVFNNLLKLHDSLDVMAESDGYIYGKSNVNINNVG